MLAISDDSSIMTNRMAGLDIGGNGAGQLPNTAEKRSTPGNAFVRVPRRKFTLITITILLNVLHWSSFTCIFTSVYQIIATPGDRTSIPSEVLTLLSVSFAKHKTQSIAYSDSHS
jgi:hypothetical protein